MSEKTTQTNYTTEISQIKKRSRLLKRYLTDVKKILETLRKISLNDPAPPGYVGYFLEILDDKFEKLETKMRSLSSKT